MSPLLVVALALGLPALGSEEDAKGSRDHPLVSRLPGSTIIKYDYKEFDRYAIVVGNLKQRELPFEQIEGRVTRIAYRLLEAGSAIEAGRSYQQALEKAGFETLYRCEGCGGGTFFLKLNDLPGEGKLSVTENPDINMESDHRYAVSRLRRLEGDVYVAVYAYRQLGNKAPVARVRVVEVQAMRAGLVTVDAAAMAEDLNRLGKVAIYGVYFDSERTEIKPESEPTLREMAKLFQDHAGLSVYIVGHTDDTGSLEHNQDLSRRRAEAVVHYLTTRLGVAASRLSPHGAGPIAPAAPNTTEEGKARNRRVELVKRLP